MALMESTANALKVWEEKLAFFREEEATAVDPNVQFGLRRGIEDLERQVESLRHGGSLDEIGAESVALINKTNELITGALQHARETKHKTESASFRTNIFHGLYFVCLIIGVGGFFLANNEDHRGTAFLYFILGILGARIAASFKSILDKISEKEAKESSAKIESLMTEIRLIQKRGD